MRFSAARKPSSSRRSSASRASASSSPSAASAVARSAGDTRSCAPLGRTCTTASSRRCQPVAVVVVGVGSSPGARADSRGSVACSASSSPPATTRGSAGSARSADSSWPIVCRRLMYSGSVSGVSASRAIAVARIAPPRSPATSSRDCARPSSISTSSRRSDSRPSVACVDSSRRLSSRIAARWPTPSTSSRSRPVRAVVSASFCSRLPCVRRSATTACSASSRRVSSASGLRSGPSSARGRSRHHHAPAAAATAISTSSHSHRAAPERRSRGGRSWESSSVVSTAGGKLENACNATGSVPRPHRRRAPPACAPARWNRR